MLEDYVSILILIYLKTYTELGRIILEQLVTGSTVDELSNNICVAYTTRVHKVVPIIIMTSLMKTGQCILLTRTDFILI